MTSPIAGPTSRMATAAASQVGTPASARRL